MTEKYPFDGFPDPTEILCEGDGVFGVYRYDLKQWRYFRIGKTGFDRKELINAIERSERAPDSRRTYANRGVMPEMRQAVPGFSISLEIPQPPG